MRESENLEYFPWGKMKQRVIELHTILLFLNVLEENYSESAEDKER